MKLTFHNYEAFMKVVEGLILEGKHFTVKSFVNDLPSFSRQNHFEITVETDEVE